MLLAGLVTLATEFVLLAGATAAPGIQLQASFDPANGANGPTAAFWAISGLTPLNNGLFYGTTSKSGVHNLGAIFEFDPLSGLLTRKAVFDGSNGGGLSSALMATANGRFLGAAINRGAILRKQSMNLHLSLWAHHS